MGAKTSFEDINPDVVAQYEELIRETLEDQYPTVDFGKGTVLFDLVIRPQALYMALNEENAENIRKSSSLLEIANNPVLADQDIVDAVLSNYRVTRTPGNKANGSITIVLTTNATTPIPENSVFYAGIRRYVTPTSYVGVPDQSLISRTTDRLITQNSDGNWEFIIEVEAEVEGEDYQLTQNTAMSAESPPPNYIRSFVTYDFLAGSTEESNEELISELAIGASGKTMSTRLNIESFIKDEYPDVTNMSIIGYGNADMRRDRHNVFDGSHGGKSDVYLQSQPRPLIVQTKMFATLVDAQTKRWQVFFGRDNFPGFYKLKKIVPVEGIPSGTDACGDPNPGTLQILNTVKSFNNAPLANGFVPDIVSYSEAAFSRFQEVTYEFKDPYTDTTGLTNMVSTHEYAIDLLQMPLISEIQDYITGHSVTAHRYDDIVRAPIPCLVSATVPIRVPAGSAINTDALASAAANSINDEGFSNELPASVICSAVQDQLPNRARVFPPLDMLGEVIMPTQDDPHFIRSASVLRVPTDHSISVSNDTVMFFATADDIHIEVEYFG
jgi:hypothetical protein